MMNGQTDQALDAVEKAITGVKMTVSAGAEVPAIDVGIENMEQVGDISARGLREMYAECAKRELEAAQALLAQAQTYFEEAKMRARAAEQLGDEMAKSHLAAVDRARKMAAHAAATRVLIEGEPELRS